MTYDVLVIGGGPAGMNAALYAARKGLATAVVTVDFGGQMLLTNEIENYLGFPSVPGYELAEKMEAHMRAYPVAVTMAEVEKLEAAEGGFRAVLDDGKEMESRAVIVTSGRRSRTLDIPGEKQYTGRGVSYCATCDAPFYHGKTVAVVGGGDSAVGAAIELAAKSPRVYLLVRSRLRAQEVLVRRMREHENITVITGAVPEEICGTRKVEAVVIRHTESGETERLAVDGCFVEAGGIPNGAFLPEGLLLNGAGEIVTDKSGVTNIPGLFAAGDVTDAAEKQVAAAVGEGAAAALSAYDYLLRSEA